MILNKSNYRPQNHSHLHYSQQIHQPLQTFILKLNTQQSQQPNTQSNIPQYDPQLQSLKLSNNQLYLSLNKKVQQYATLYKQYLSLIQNQNQSIQEEYQRAQSNIYYIQNQIQRLTHICTQQSQQKQKYLKSSHQYSIKHRQLSMKLHDQTLNVNKKISFNKRKEEQIKIHRQIYLKLQEEIFNLDIHVQNLKKYGYQQIPQELSLYIKQKQQLRGHICQINDRIDYQNKNINKMIKKQIYNKVQNEVILYRQKMSNMQQLKEQNIVLRKSIKELQDIQKGCEHPNHQINSLESSIKESTTKIAELQKQSNLINKKNNQILKKIENINRKQYQKTQSIKNITQNKHKQQSSINTMKNTRKTSTKQKQPKTKLFNQIKHDLQTQGKGSSKNIIQNANNSISQQNKHNDNMFIQRFNYKKYGLIWISDNQYKIRVKSKKLKIVYMAIVLIIFMVFTCK